MSNYKGGSFATYLEAANRKTPRRGFIVCAAPVIAAETLKPHNPRMIVICDVCLIETQDIRRLAEDLGEMGLRGPVLGVDLDGRGEPIRLLNIDNIPPETVDSLISKFKEYINA